MVVMRLGCRLIARAAVAEIVAVENPRLFEQAYGAVNGGDRNAAVDRRGAFIERLDVGMILGIGDHARDDPALFGDPQTLFVAPSFKFDRSGHAALSCWCAPPSQN